MLIREREEHVCERRGASRAGAEGCGDEEGRAGAEAVDQPPAEEAAGAAEGEYGAEAGRGPAGTCLIGSIGAPWEWYASLTSSPRSTRLTDGF